MTSYEDAAVIVFFGAFLGSLIIAAIYVRKIRPFIMERRYIKMELKRARGREYEYWKRQLKKFYARHIPIIGRFIG